MKRLYKSNTNKVVAGVIGGIGEYFNVDPTILRLIYVLITVMTGFVPALFAYIVAYFIVPEKPLHHDVNYTEKPKEEPKKEEVKTEPLDI